MIYYDQFKEVYFYDGFGKMSAKYVSLWHTTRNQAFFKVALLSATFPFRYAFRYNQTVLRGYISIGEHGHIRLNVDVISVDVLILI